MTVVVSTDEIGNLFRISRGRQIIIFFLVKAVFGLSELFVPQDPCFIHSTLDICNVK